MGDYGIHKLNPIKRYDLTDNSFYKMPQMYEAASDISYNHRGITMPQYDGTSSCLIFTGRWYMMYILTNNHACMHISHNVTTYTIPTHV